MTRVKICGITNRDDALMAAEAGADALGFVFEPSSPRFVGPLDGMLSVLENLPPYLARVAVFGTQPPDAKAYAERFDAIQSPGARPPFLHPACRWIRAVRPQVADSTEFAEPLSADAFLLDTYDPEKLGGTGEPMDWMLAAEIVRSLRNEVILAGGLDPGNVAKAIRTVEPYAVDVCTGVEASPGKKDRYKVLMFIREVRAHDLEQA